MGAPIAAKQGGTGASSITAGLDLAFGSTQGSVLYRDASVWKVLGPGTSGQVLQSGGSGANPSWVAPGNVFDDGCCLVSVTSTTSLLLKPLNGNTLWVGGQACTIPAAGVTLSGQTGLTAGTVYYVYATASGGAVNALALSTTGHITGSDGREYLSSGGSTPSAVTTSRLVGMLYTNAASAPFLDAPATRYLLNWFNRRNLSIASTLSQGQSASQSELYLGGGAAVFLTWGDEPVSLTAYGSSYNNVANAQQTVWAAIDGSNVSAPSYAFSSAANAFLPHSASGSALLSEGIHNGTAGVVTNGGGSGGTATYQLAVSGIIRG